MLLKIKTTKWEKSKNNTKINTLMRVRAVDGSFINK